MYTACRHIKPNGVRCESPALRGGSFCYFHAKLHTRASDDAARFGPITLPVLENPAAIQIAISRIFDAMLNDRIDGKLAGRLLYGLQIASQHADRSPIDLGIDTVKSMTKSGEGDELAPVLHICNRHDICVGCKYIKGCPDYDPKNDGKNDDDDE